MTKLINWLFFFVFLKERSFLIDRLITITFDDDDECSMIFDSFDSCWRSNSDSFSSRDSFDWKSKPDSFVNETCCFVLFTCEESMRLVSFECELTTSKKKSFCPSEEDEKNNDVTSLFSLFFEIASSWPFTSPQWQSIKIIFNIFDSSKMTFFDTIIFLKVEFHNLY